MALEDAKNEVDAAFTRSDLKGPGFENTFAGATSFLRRRYTKDLTQADAAVTGIPFDQSVTNRPGTRLGPRAIREASALQSPDAPYGWGYDVMSDFAIADYGDMAFDYAYPAGVPQRIEAHIAGILAQDCAVVTLGGDHSITLPILRAHVAKHGPLALVQFDAHTDSWPDDDPSRVDHGTFVYKAVKEGLIDVPRSIQIGIRTTNEDPMGITIVDAPEVHRIGPAAVVERIRETVGAGPAYLTFDIDGLDPAFAPGTGTPVWGGLSSGQAAAILRGMAGLDIVGGDVVEVSPPFDTTGATAIAAAHVATDILSLWGYTRR
ncbi:agmatinase [Maritimibacter sp. UBA3975]|uniref:agmatinase n=1 Tax=Maritimibacter sp. UBA3975 TaxID=1946833 RepID=UPI000C0B41AC|nr:agmatinase [Maritimibacter sp. UBA3975]MAM60608.1 agmatinase [Maritimibacter sp.]|tara:strand:+ start:20413 stop:21372 length:960 start_codon:yes stop_codon:yes gene_type:complete